MSHEVASALLWSIKPNDSDFPANVSIFDSLINKAAVTLSKSRIKVEGKWKALCTRFSCVAFTSAFEKNEYWYSEDSGRSMIQRVARMNQPCNCLSEKNVRTQDVWWRVLACPSLQNVLSWVQFAQRAATAGPLPEPAYQLIPQFCGPFFYVFVNF